MIARDAALVVMLALGGSLASADPRDPARRITVDLRCVWSVDRAELLAALALELAGSGWDIAAEDAGADLVVSLDASPCETSAAIRIGVADRRARRGAAVLDPIELAPGARARSLALLIAELLAAAGDAPPPAEPPVALPAPTAPPPPPPAERDERARSLIATGLSAAFTATYISRYMKSSTGLRLTVARDFRPWLRAAADLGGDRTGAAFDLTVGRAGAQLGVRGAFNPRVSFDAMARGELAVAHVQPEAATESDGRMWHLVTSRDWLGGLAGGGLFGAEVSVLSWLGVRLEVEATFVVAAHRVGYQWVPTNGSGEPLYPQHVLRSGMGLSVGVVIR